MERLLNLRRTNPTLLRQLALRNQWAQREQEGQSALQEVGETIKDWGTTGLVGVAKLLDAAGNLVRTSLRSGVDLVQGRSVRAPSLFDTYSGRDLLRDIGLVGDEDTWGNYLAGLAAEIVLDPLTYLTLGGGKVVEEVAKVGGRGATRALVRDALRTEIGKAAMSAARSESRLASRLIGEKAIQEGFVPYRVLQRKLTPLDLLKAQERIASTETSALSDFASDVALPNLARAAEEAGQVPLNQVGRTRWHRVTDRLGEFVKANPELANTPLRTQELGWWLPGGFGGRIPLGRFELPVAALKDRLLYEVGRMPGIRGLRRAFMPTILGAKSPIVQSFGNADMMRRDLDAVGHLENLQSIGEEVAARGYEYPKEPRIAISEAVAHRMLAEGVDPSQAMTGLKEHIRYRVFGPTARRLAGKIAPYVDSKTWENLASFVGLDPKSDPAIIMREIISDPNVFLDDVMQTIAGGIQTPGLQLSRLRSSITKARSKLTPIYNQVALDIEKTPLWGTLSGAKSVYPHIEQSYGDIFQRLRDQDLKQILAETYGRGVSLENLLNAGDETAQAGYWPRHAPARESVGPFPTSPIGKATDPSRFGRMGILRETPGGTGTLMALLSDENVIKYATSKDVGGLTTYLKRAYSPAIGKRDYNALAKWIVDQPPALLESGFFAADPLIDYAKRLANYQRLASNADLVRDVLVQPGVLKRWGQRSVKQGKEIVSVPVDVPKPFQQLITPATEPPKKVYLLGDLLNELGYTKDAIARLLYTPEWKDAFSQYHQSAVANILANAQKQGVPLTAQEASQVAMDELIENMRHLVVDPTVAEDLLRRHSSINIPSYLQKAHDLAEAYTNVFRGHATILRPAFHVGNLISGLAQSAFTRKFRNPKQAFTTIKDVTADFLGKGEIPLGRYKALEAEFARQYGRNPQTPQELGDFLSALARNLEVTGKPGIDVAYSIPDDLLQQQNLIEWLESARPASGTTIPLAGQNVPGLFGGRLRKLLHGMLYVDDDTIPNWVTSPKGIYRNLEFWKDVGQRGILENLRKSFSIRGAIDLTPYTDASKPFLQRQIDKLQAIWRGDVDTGRRIADTRMPAARYGEHLSGKVETINRLVPFLRLLEEGYSPMAAAERVGLEQVSYLSRHYTPLEKFLASWPIPFYKFNRGMVRFLADELGKHPAGPYAQLLRSYRLAQEDNPFVPDYLRDTLGFPVGRTADGGQLYLTGIGLMPEQVLSMASTDPAELARNILSNTTPIIRGPIEYATGHSLWQLDRGEPRSIRQVRPLLGTLLSNLDHYLTGERLTGGEPVKLGQFVETTVSNLPFTSELSLLKNVTDYRKPVWARLLSPLSRVRVVYLPQTVMDNVMRDRLEEFITSDRIGGRLFERAYVPDEQLQRLPLDDQRKAKAAETLLNLLAQRAKAAKAGARLASPDDDLIPDEYIEALLHERLQRSLARHPRRKIALRRLSSGRP